jgi:hypothetical protein
VVGAALVVCAEVAAVVGALDVPGAVVAAAFADVGDVAAALLGAVLAGVLLLVVLPGSACAYPPASTTAPAADATVIQPVAVRTRRSPRSRASARRCASKCGKLGLLGRRSLPGRDLHGPEPSLTDRRFGICLGNVQIR